MGRLVGTTVVGTCWQVTVVIGSGAASVATEIMAITEDPDVFPDGDFGRRFSAWATVGQEAIRAAQILVGAEGRDLLGSPTAIEAPAYRVTSIKRQGRAMHTYWTHEGED